MSMIIARVLALVKMPSVSSLPSLQKFVSDKVSRVAKQHQTAQIESSLKPQFLAPKEVKKVDAQHPKEFELSENFRKFLYGKKFRCGEPLVLDLRKKPSFTIEQAQELHRKMLSGEMTEKNPKLPK